VTNPIDARAGDDRDALASLDRLAGNIGELLGVSSVALALLDPDTGDLVARVLWGPAAERAGQRRLRPNEGIEGRVAARLEPVLLDDLRAQPGVRTLAPDPRPGSLVCLPLQDGDRLLGTLTVTAAQPGAFDEWRQRVLWVVAEQAVLSIAKTVQAAAAQAQARELIALLEASRALTSSLEPERVFAHIASSIRTVVGCDDAIIYAYEPHTATLRMVTGLGPRITRLGAARIPVSDTRSLAARVATEGRPRLVAPKAGEVGQVTEVFLGGDPLSLLCAPLISKKRLRGVIMLARPEPFRPAALTTMLNLSNIIAAALENAELYQAERGEREQLAAIFVSASDAIALVDNGGRLLEVNDAFAALVGLPQTELRGRPCREVLRQAAPESPLADEQGALARVLARGEAALHVESAFAVDVDEPGSTSAPGRRYIDFSVTPIAGREGRRALLVGRDITAQREVEQLKASFLAMISHELRGPLQTLDGFLDLALSGAGGALNAQQREFVQRARSGSQRLATIVDDLLLLSRRDAGQFALRQELTDLAPVVAEAADEVGALADEAGVRLEVDVPERLPPVLADAPRIAQVLRNLLSNAIKFTARGGHVTLSAEADAASVVLRVRDTGKGIAPEHQAKIFDRFYQAPSSGERGRASGQGLGLAIARIIVEGHGGTITVESVPGRGSVFSVRLPLLPG